MAGTLLAVAGIGIPANSVWAAAATTLPFAAVAVWQQRSLLLQFLIASVALTLVVLAAWDHWDHVVTDLPAICIPFGVALLLYPPRHDMRPTAFALLVVPLLLETLTLGFESGWALWFGWPAKMLFLVVFAFLFAVNWRRVTDSHGRLLAGAGAAAAVAIALLLPTGASAALVLLALAYTLGSRPLAAIGALAAVYFIWRFYADLQDTLLTKSIILMSAGALLLICYGLLAGTLRARGRS